MENPLLTIAGNDALVDLFPDRLRLNRDKSLLTKTNRQHLKDLLDTALTTEKYLQNSVITKVTDSKEILLSSISSTRIEHNQALGYLYLTYAGGDETVSFQQHQVRTFELFKRALDKRIGLKVNSPMEELLHLEKLAELKEKGVLTEEEYNTKKQLILGGGLDSRSIEEIKEEIEKVQQEYTVDTDNTRPESQDNDAESRHKFLRWIGLAFGVLCALSAGNIVAQGRIGYGLAILALGITITPWLDLLLRKITKGRVNHPSSLTRLILIFSAVLMLPLTYYPVSLQSFFDTTQPAEQNLNTSDTSEIPQETEAEKRARYELNESDKEKLAALMAGKVITNLECMNGEATINEDAWDYFDIEAKKVFGKLVFDYCRSRDYMGQGGFKFLSSQTGHVLGGYHWYSGDKLYVK